MGNGGLTKSSEMGQPLRRIRHGSNQPIRCGLPHRVQQAKEDVKHHMRSISLVPNSQLLFGRHAFPRIIPNQPTQRQTLWKKHERDALLIIPRPNMHPHNHTQQNGPRQERSNPPSILLLIKQQPDQNAPDDLSDPIHRIVQGPSLDVKQHSIVIAELPSVKIIAGEEHGKEEDDERVGSDRYPETFEFGLPRRMSRGRDSRTVGSDHLVWGCHY